MTYADWIAANVTKAYGQCAEVTEAMADAFPELTRVRGRYLCPIWGERDHWWLIAPDGSIVDPTASQFPSKGGGEYVEWDEAAIEPTGMCPNCGGPCYDHNSLCSDECGRDYVAYCNSFR